jgi:hypothetical protein
MKKILSVLAVSALLTAPVFAGDNEKDHGHHDKTDQSAMPSNGMMNMMSQEQMTAMHKHMQKMQEMMSKIEKEKDADKREELMQQHMQAMQEGMQMMGDGMRMGMGMGMGKEKPADTKMGTMDMAKRMEMMEQRMGMMQMMMGQMLDREAESKKAPDHEHEK